MCWCGMGWRWGGSWYGESSEGGLSSFGRVGGGEGEEEACVGCNIAWDGERDGPVSTWGGSSGDSIGNGAGCGGGLRRWNGCCKDLCGVGRAATGGSGVGVEGLGGRGGPCTLLWTCAYGSGMRMLGQTSKLGLNAPGICNKKLSTGEQE